MPIHVLVGAYGNGCLISYITQLMDIREHFTDFPSHGVSGLLGELVAHAAVCEGAYMCPGWQGMLMGEVT